MTARPSATDPAQRRTVLVVDDSRFVRTTIVRSLGAEFELRQADSGERGWETLLLDESVDAVLSDLTMPGMDGFELLRRVRASTHPRISRLPFVVLSGADEPAQREQAKALGADHFVVKGAGFEGLGAWLAERIDRSDAAEDRDAGTAAGRTATDPPPAATEPAVPVDSAGAAALPAAGAAAVSGEPIASPDRADRRDDALWCWLERALPARAADDATPVLVRLSAPGHDDLAARLRRGVRASDALHQQDPHTAWLLVATTGASAVRLALRFALLAIGRPGRTTPGGVQVCLHAFEPADAGAALLAIASGGRTPPPSGMIAVECSEGPLGPAWRFELPPAAARVLAG